MAVNIPIWPGSSSFTSGDTPFGHYDSDSDFTTDVDNIASWCAKRLGYPIVDIELQDINFYACVEEAVTEYSTQVNQFNIRENLLNLKGSSTGSNLSQTQLNANLGGMISLAKDYGTEAGSGGRVTYYTGSFEANASQQVYDLTDASLVSLESGTPGVDKIEIKKMLHNAPPAMVRYFDPFVGTGLGSQQMMDTFGWGNYSPGVSFMMSPLYDDLLRLQAIEFNDMVRKSQYGFDIQNNRVRLFPIPEQSYTIHFHYILESDRSNSVVSTSVVSDYSNVNYDFMKYSNINDVGKQWIRSDALSLTKEILGQVRSKLGSIPIPGNDITLNGPALVSEAKAEQAELREELKAVLDELVYGKLAEGDAELQKNVESVMASIPYGIYVG